MEHMPITRTMKRYLKLSLAYLTLMVLTLAFSGKLIAQDSVINMAADSSMVMAQDTAKAKSSQSLMETIANDKTLLYIIAAVVFVLIIGLTFLSSIRKSKNQNTGNIHHHKPSGGHHHHHKHRMHRYH